MPEIPPFDPAAALAAVRRYTPPSGANLLHALADWPDRFGGAVPIGHGGDKIQLPDGRIYDCIVNVSGPPSARAWQMALVDPSAATGDADPFALEAGPLDYVDEAMPFGPLGGPSMESIAADALEPLNGADAVLGGGADAIAAFDLAGAVTSAGGDALDDAAAAHAEIRDALGADDLADVVDAAGGHDGEISSGQHDYVEAEVPAQPVPDPGDAPGHDGDGGDIPPAI